MKKVIIPLGNSQTSPEQLIYDFSSLADENIQMDSRYKCRLCGYDKLWPMDSTIYCSHRNRLVIKKGIKLKWYQKFRQKETPDVLCKIPSTHRHFTCPNCQLEGIIIIKTLEEQLQNVQI